MGSSSPPIPLIGISVPSMAPTTLGKRAMQWNRCFIFFRDIIDDGNVMFCKCSQRAWHTFGIHIETGDFETPWVSPTSEKKSAFAMKRNHIGHPFKNNSHLLCTFEVKAFFFKIRYTCSQHICQKYVLNLYQISFKLRLLLYLIWLKSNRL